MKRGIIVSVLLGFIFFLFLVGTLSPYTQITSVHIDRSGTGPIYSSPSEDRILYVSDRGAIIYDIDGNKLAENSFSYDFLRPEIGVVWSPDEKIIMFQDQDLFYFVNSNNLTINSIVSKNDLLQSIDSPNTYWRTTHLLTEDYKLIFYHNNTIWKYNIDSTSISRVLSINDTKITNSWALISADGKGIAFQLNSTAWDIYNLQTLEVTEIRSNLYVSVFPSSKGNEFVIVEEKDDRSIEQDSITSLIQVYDTDLGIFYPNFEISNKLLYLSTQDKWQWSTDTGEILIIQPDFQEDNKVEVSDLITIINYKTGEISWEQTFNKGIIYDASIIGYRWLSTKNKLVILDYNGHTEKTLMIMNLEHRAIFELSMYLINFLGVLFGLFLLSLYFMFAPNHFEYLRKNLRFGNKSYDYQSIKFLSDDTLRSDEVNRIINHNENTNLKESMDEINWIPVSLLFFNFGMIVMIILNFTPIGSESEDVAYSYLRTIIHGLFAYWDIFSIGILTLTYIAINRHHHSKNKQFLLIVGYTLWGITVIVMRYYQGFSIGNQVPHLNPDIVYIFNFLRLYLIYHLLLLRENKNPFFNRWVGDESMIFAILLIVIDFWVILVF